jgi:hypothetical protein
MASEVIIVYKRILSCTNFLHLFSKDKLDIPREVKRIYFSEKGNMHSKMQNIDLFEQDDHIPYGHATLLAAFYIFIMH